MLQGVKDKRFRTDMMPVRKAMRFVYRSVPHADFVRMTNYLLKTLRFIKSDELATHWWGGRGGDE